MQYSNDSHFIKRAVAYASRAYLDQRKKRENETKRDDKTKTGGYEDMRRVIFFAIMAKPLFPHKQKYLSHHKVTDVCTGENDIKELSFSFLELSKFEKDSINQLETNIEKWAYFFKYAASVDPEEMKALEEKDERFWRAYTALAEYNYTPEELLDYERYDMKYDEIITSISDARKEGRAEGKAEGIAEGKAEGIAEGELKGKREMALGLLQSGVDVDIIARTSGLSIEEINSLMNKQ
jgi:predicted transposase/invertase (TIGR01784 family)